jgi:hypothetical protein
LNLSKQLLAIELNQFTRVIGKNRELLRAPPTFSRPTTRTPERLVNNPWKAPRSDAPGEPHAAPGAASAALTSSSNLLTGKRMVKSRNMRSPISCRETKHPDWARELHRSKGIAAGEQRQPTAWLPRHDAMHRRTPVQVADA